MTNGRLTTMVSADASFLVSVQASLVLTPYRTSPYHSVSTSSHSRSKSSLESDCSCILWVTQLWSDLG